MTSHQPLQISEETRTKIGARILGTTLTTSVNADPHFDDLVEKYKWFENPLEWYKRSGENIKTYHNNLNTIFENTTIDISSIESHRKCREFSDESTDILELFTIILELSTNLTKSKTLEEAYSYAVQIPPFYKRRNKIRR